MKYDEVYWSVNEVQWSVMKYDEVHWSVMKYDEV